MAKDDLGSQDKIMKSREPRVARYSYQVSRKVSRCAKVVAFEKHLLCGGLLASSYLICHMVRIEMERAVRYIYIFVILISITRVLNN